jgi:hypothetical protein
MSFDPKDLEPLAGALLKAGAPILGGIIGGPFGAVIGSLIPQIAGAFGLAPDTTPSNLATVVAADPNAATKLAAIENASETALDYAKLQADQNKDELSADGPLPFKFFLSGWRPAMGWVSGPIIVVYQIIASAAHLPLIPNDLLAWITPIWVGLAGLRTYERAQGVAVDNLPGKKPGK